MLIFGCQIKQIWVIFTHLSRYRVPQLQVDENKNKITWRIKDLNVTRTEGTTPCWVS